MIASLVPASIAGMILHQAESNADWPGDYAALFPAMNRQWRAEWGREAPFYFGQRANFNGTPTDRAANQWAWLRDAQARTLALPRTGMTVIIDIGTPDNTHPKNTQDVGRRLALLARRNLLDENVSATGPLFAGVRREGAALRVKFDAAEGLYAGGRAPSRLQGCGRGPRIPTGGDEHRRHDGGGAGVAGVGAGSGPLSMAQRAGCALEKPRRSPGPTLSQR